MNLDILIAQSTDFFHQHSLLAPAVVAGFVLYAFFRPKKAFRLAGLTAFVICSFYLAALLTDSISKEATKKDKMVNKSTPYLDD